MHEIPGHIRLLLLQARDKESMLLQEQSCFVERCRISAGQIITLNVTRDLLDPGILTDVDVVMIGGAGAYSAMKDYEWMARLLDFVRDTAERQVPLFGSCWGHQVIARAFGGAVIYDPERAELGCREVQLTEAGESDPLFGLFPSSFYTNMGHHDRVSVLPDGAVELANNESQPNQAFRLRDLPVYGTQFHSELDAQRERERLIEYRDFYIRELPTEAAFQEVIASLRATTEVDSLMFHFLMQTVVNAGDVANPVSRDADAAPTDVSR